MSVAELFVGFLQYYLTISSNRQYKQVPISFSFLGKENFSAGVTKKRFICTDYVFQRTLAVLGSGFNTDKIKEYDADTLTLLQDQFFAKCRPPTTDEMLVSDDDQEGESDSDESLSDEPMS